MTAVVLTGVRPRLPHSSRFSTSGYHGPMQLGSGSFYHAMRHTSISALQAKPVYNSFSV